MYMFTYLIRNARRNDNVIALTNIIIGLL